MRLRLLLPVIIATVGLVGLGVVQTLAAVQRSTEGVHGQVIAETAVATVRLEHQLEQEIAEVTALRARGGSVGSALVVTAQAQTDQAIAAFRLASAHAASQVPALRPLLSSAAGELATLRAVRQRASATAATQSTGTVYDRMSEALLLVADALPGQLTNPVLAAGARAAAAITVDEHLAAEQRDILRTALSRRSFAGSEQVRLATLVGARQEREGEFARFATGEQRAVLASLASTSDAQTADTMLTTALNSFSTVQGDPETWFIAQTSVMRKLHVLQNALTRQLAADALAEEYTARNTMLITVISTSALVVLAMVAALVLAIRTSRRLRHLRGTALGVAYEELPDAITALNDAPDLDRLREVIDIAGQRAGGLAVAGVDEIAEVGSALSQVHRQAVRLAADQAALRMDTSALFVALSRRGQTLVQRQLQLLEEFEDAEADPQRLSRLIALGHLAARMRRNEENVLVLSGGEPASRITSTVSLADVILAAGAEIEEHGRVSAAEIADVGVTAHVVRDLVHLLAELLENATFFSPPTTVVRVTARRTVDAVTLAIFDEGIGMPQSRLAEVNQRLAKPSSLTAELAGTMGLLVVARLAQRHHIEVSLRSVLRGGTVALVAVPDALVEQAPAVAVQGISRLSTPRLVIPRQRSGGRSETVVVEATVVAGTGAQRRTPGPVPQAPGTRTPAAAEVSRLPPDPDAVRARLSGLASGLAAASRIIGERTDRPEPPAAPAAAPTAPPAAPTAPPVARIGPVQYLSPFPASEPSAATTQDGSL